MHERPERVPRKTAFAVLQHHAQADVPHVARIRERETVLGAWQRGVQERLRGRIAADDAVKSNDRGGREVRSHREKVGMNKLDRVRSPDPFRFLPSGLDVRGRCVDRDRASHTAIEKPECKRTDAGADVQKAAIRRSDLCNTVQKQTRRRSWALHAVSRHFRSSLLFVELMFRCVFERRATGCHGATAPRTGSRRPRGPSHRHSERRRPRLVRRSG